METKWPNILAELVSTETSFSEQARKMVELLDRKLSDESLKLNPDDRKLLEEAKKGYQGFADNPYPWFGEEVTPDKIKEMPLSAQVELYHNLSQDLKNNNSEKATIINQRVAMIQWITMNYIEHLNRIINTQDTFKLNQKSKSKEINTQNEKDKDIISQGLIAPVQRLPRLVLLTNELHKSTPPDQKMAIASVESLQKKWGTTTSQTDTLVELFENKSDIKKMSITRLPYAVSLIEKELEYRANLTTQLKGAKKSLQTSVKSNKTIQEKKNAVENLEKKIKAVDGAIEKKIHVFELFTTSNYQSKIQSLASRKEVAQLIADVRQYETEMTSLFDQKTYDNIHNALQYKDNENKIAAFENLSPIEREIFTHSDPKSKLQNLTATKIKNLTVDVRLHREEIRLLFGNTPNLENTLQALVEKKNGPKVFKAAAALSAQEIVLFRMEKPNEIKNTLEALRKQDLMKLNAAFHGHHKEITLLFGEQAYKNMSKTFAEAYQAKNLTAPAKELAALSNQEIALFTAPNSKPILQRFNIEDLTKLAKNIRAHRKEITHIFGQEAYQDMGKALVERYQEYKKDLITQNKGTRENLGGYTHQEKFDASASLLNAIGTSIKSLNPQTLKALNQGRLRDIAKPLVEIETEKAKLNPDPPAPSTTPTRPGHP